VSIQVLYIFRKPDAQRHSIEKLFEVIRSVLPKSISHSALNMPYHSNGILAIIRNMIYARKHKQPINHITGDIHYTAMLLPRSTTLLTIHDAEILNRTSGLKHLFIKWIWFVLPAMRVKYITVISEFSAAELKKHIPRFAHKIKVVHNCISSQFTFFPKPFNQEKPVLLHLGTKANKNLMRLIEAVKGMNISLYIAGELPIDAKLLLEKNKIDFVNKSFLNLFEIIEWYKLCDVLCFVSTYEGFGLPILEAQATGRAVITSKAASMPEVAGDGALLVDPYSVEEISKAIVEVINNQTLRESLIEKGLANANRFNAHEVARQYAEIYTSMLK